MSDEKGQASTDASMDRVTMAEAAKRLGVTKDAIRKRVQRGNLPYDKDDAGVIHVYLDGGDGHPRTGGQMSVDNPKDELVDELRSRVRFLEGELQRKDAILLNMTETMKALTAPSEPRDGRETASEEASGTPTPLDQRPWWRRLFGL